MDQWVTDWYVKYLQSKNAGAVWTGLFITHFCWSKILVWFITSSFYFKCWWLMCHITPYNPYLFISMVFVQCSCLLLQVEADLYDKRNHTNADRTEALCHFLFLFSLAFFFLLYLKSLEMKLLFFFDFFRFSVVTVYCATWCSHLLIEYPQDDRRHFHAHFQVHHFVLGYYWKRFIYFNTQKSFLILSTAGALYHSSVWNALSSCPFKAPSPEPPVSSDWSGHTHLSDRFDRCV